MEDIQDPSEKTEKSAHLIALKGPKAGQSTKLTAKRVLLGRAADADLLLSMMRVCLGDTPRLYSMALIIG